MIENPQEESPALVDRKWSEIRKAWSSGSYADFYESHLDRAENAPQDRLDLSNDEASIDEIDVQIEKASPLSVAQELGITPGGSAGAMKAPEIRVLDNDDHVIFTIEDESGKKIWIKGSNVGAEMSEGDVLTRMYLAFDPRVATDAFCGLAKEFRNHGLLDQFDCCLYLEPVKEYSLTTNTVVIYIFGSQDKHPLLDEIMSAYRTFKEGNPRFFSLSQAERDALLLRGLRSFRCIVDSQLTFVDMGDDEYRHGSWDAGKAVEIYNELGIDPLDRRMTPEEMHRATIKALREKEQSGVVWGTESKEQLQRIISGETQLKEGEVIKLKAKRRMNCPGLITYEERRFVVKDGRLVPMTVER